MRLVRPSKFQMRYRPEPHSAEDAGLKESIREHGLLQPLVIRPVDHGFELVAGHRRFAACRSLRWRFVTCKIRDLSDRQAYEIQLTENLQRRSLDPIEEAEAYQAYVAGYGWGGVAELARGIGRSEEYVSHRMQLLRMPEGVRQKLASSDLSVSQALELTGVEDRLRGGLAEEIVSGGLTVRQIRVLKRERAGRARGGQAPVNVLKKGGLALKIALSRVDDLIEDSHRMDPRQGAEMVKFLMGLRLQIHSMIDDTIRMKKSYSRPAGGGAHPRRNRACSSPVHASARRGEPACGTRS